MKDYKDFTKQYYLKNTVWSKYVDLDSIPKFKNIAYDDFIIFHYNLTYSIFKVSTSTNYSKNIFISAINVCLRYYQLIKKLYPYNKVRVIIHVHDKIKVSIDVDTFKSILDIIPNFAVCSEERFNILDFDNSFIKHIFYGCSYDLTFSDSQQFKVSMGHLSIKEEYA